MSDSTVGQSFSDRTFQLCTASDSVSSLLAADPALAPGEAWHKLFGHHVGKPKSSHAADDAGKGPVSKEALERAAKCGKWGPTQPSDLFLRIYHDALGAIDENPANAVVSPSLMGSCGVVPLTIISVIPDIARHMSNVIVRAEREVFLATNYWQDSVASKFLTNAMRELSRRAGERKTKVVMKIIYDRGSPRQLIEPHYLVGEKEYTGKNVALPPPHEIPNIDLQVVNFHQPVLGTFHCKFMVVDRKIAILQSNNIQDNDNVEMMVHLEGPIVDSMYDMALISWHRKLEPPLPSANSPAAAGGLGSFGDKHDAILGSEGAIRGHTAVVDPQMMPPRASYDYKKPAAVREPGAVGPDAPPADIVAGPTTTESTTHPVGTAEHRLSVHYHDANGQGANHQAEAKNTPNGPDLQTRNFLNSGEQAIPQAQIQEPGPPGDARLPEHAADDPHYDDDIAGEVARVQTAVSAKPGESHMEAVTRLLNHTTNKGFKGDAPACAPGEEMTPYIPHRTHEPFPMALVNRAAYGPPTHKSVLQPQNAAWLSALRNATKNVFIQSPTLNAEPLIPAIREACERGVDVYCYITLGYNDTGELLPRQGGHNEMVAHKLYESLSAAARDRLHYFWYVGKDQTAPVVQEKKRRSCHVKLMIVDETIGIMGNGNQDTQSWYHSQEINVMLESADVCHAWIDGLRRNQNTHLYGALDARDGVWRDSHGDEADGVIGVDPGRFSWARGMVGAVQRVRGVGGF